jgi:hypothetical protein
MNMKSFIFNEKVYTFENEELEKAYLIAKENGFLVHTFIPSGYKISQIFVDNGETFGSISASYGGLSYSTCHKSTRNSGNGSGFGIDGSIMPCESASIEKIKQVFMFAPNWAKNLHTIKKETWQEHISHPISKILSYVDL